MKKFSKQALALAMIFSALYIFGCSSSAIDVSKLSPEELVQTYYKSLASGDIETARACLSKDYAKDMDQFQDSDFTNLESVTNIFVKPASCCWPVHYRGAEVKAVQMVVTYEAHYKIITGADNGKQLRFVAVYKVDGDSSWKIISIGSGP